MIKIKERLKSQKGITAGDVLIALFLILTSISIIGMIYLNIKTVARMVNSKSGATRIATNIIENAKATFFDEVQNYDSTVPETQQRVLNTKIPKGYSVVITVENVEEDVNSLLKKVNVVVNYNKNNSNDTVNLSTVIEREKIRECNSPNFSEEYIQQMVGENNSYQIYQNVNDIENNKKIICPIKYNGENYVIVKENEINSMWYSYSDKQWARAIVFNNLTELERYVDTDSNSIIDNSILKDNDKSFVWVPRFKVDNLVSPDKLYFMYKSTNNAILHSTGNNVYYYINASDETLNNNLQIYFTEVAGQKPEVGRWFKYFYIKNLNQQDNEIVKKLYESEYGPMFEL